jgi:hypothetical protein
MDEEPTEPITLRRGDVMTIHVASDGIYARIFMHRGWATYPQGLTAYRLSSHVTVRLAPGQSIMGSSWTDLAESLGEIFGLVGPVTIYTNRPIFPGDLDRGWESVDKDKAGAHYRRQF